MASGQAYPIIDPHVHVWEWDPAFPFAPGADVPAQDASPEMLLELMRANGVAHAVLIQVRHYRYNNDYLAAVLRRYPQAFLGVARVDPLDPAAPDHLSRLTLEQGFSGVRLSPTADAGGDWITGPLMPPLWRRCQDLAVPMTLLAPVTRMPDLVPLIERHQGLTVVIDHMAGCPVGQPRELAKLTALARFPKVFVKLSNAWGLSRTNYPWPDALDLIRALHDAFGPQRLMWATDWPIGGEISSYAQRVGLYRDGMPFLSEDDRSWIRSRTIQQVWPFD